MKSILIKCPICSKSKLQSISESIVNNQEILEDKTNVILIPENTICEHNFLIEIDKNWNILDYYTIEDYCIIYKKEFTSFNNIDAFVKSLNLKTINKILSGL